MLFLGLRCIILIYIMITYNLLNELLLHLKELDDDFALWFVKGINSALEGSQTLDRALGIRGMRYAYLKQKRDGYLHQAWESLPENLTDWKRSSKLADIIFRFEFNYFGIFCLNFCFFNDINRIICIKPYLGK